MWHKVNFKRSLTGWIQFSFSKAGCHTKVKEPNLSYYLLVAGGRITGFLSFPRILGKMQTASSGIWTRVAVLISYDGIYYTTKGPISPLDICIYPPLDVCIYPPLDICIYPPLDVCIYPPLDICIYPPLDVCIYPPLDICIYPPLDVCIYSPLDVCIYPPLDVCIYPPLDICIYPALHTSRVWHKVNF